MEQPSDAAPAPRGGASRAVRRARPLLLLAGGLLLCTLWGCSFSRRMIFPGSPAALPAPGTELAPGLRVIGYQSEDGVALRDLLVRGGGAAPRPAAVYFHGNAESAAENADTASLLAAAGLDVLVAEYRGYGGCEGSPSEEGLVADGRAALAAAARELSRPEGELILVGRSLGTGVVARLAGEGRGAAVALISPFTSIYEMACRGFPRPLVWLAVHDRFDSLAHLAACRRPLLVLHGTRDQMIPFAMGEELARTHGARLVPLPGADHNDVFLREGARIAREVAELARGALPAR